MFMRKNYLQFFIAVSGILIIVYIISYKFFFDWFCSGLSQETVDSELNIKKLASCNDSIVCRVVDRELKDNQVETWWCEKRKVYFLDWEYYSKIFFN